MVSRRQERVAELLKEELSILISSELTDPLLSEAMVSVTDVRVSPDLRGARVYVEHSLPLAASNDVVRALHHAEGFLRRAIAVSLNLRYVPELSFHVDVSGAIAHRIDVILDTLAAGESGAAASDVPEPITGDGE